MRIGIDATAVYSIRPTGLEMFSMNISNEMAKLHDNLVVWTVEDCGFSLPVEKVRKVMPRFHFWGSGQYVIRRPYWLEIDLPKRLRQEKIDVLYTTILSAKTQCPIPQVITVHDLFPLTFSEDSSFAIRWNYRLRVPRIVKNADAIIAVSNYTKDQILKNYSVNPDKIHVIYEGYDSHKFFQRNDLSRLAQYGLEHKNYILSVGGTRKRKNIERLVRSFASIKHQIPHKLVLVGPKTKADFSMLNALAGSLDTADRIILLDYVSTDDLPLLYSSAALLAYVSLYEGFGLPVLEAMACGTPVLASNATSIPEVAGSAAELVDPKDGGAISKAIITILTNEKLSRRMSESGLKRCTEFTWQKAAQQILDICRNCC